MINLSRLSERGMARSGMKTALAAATVGLALLHGSMCVFYDILLILRN